MVTIKLYPNGPIIISQPGSKVALCRCGQSDNKPMCDGNHKGCKLPEAEVFIGKHISVEMSNK